MAVLTGTMKLYRGVDRIVYDAVVEVNEYNVGYTTGVGFYTDTMGVDLGAGQTRDVQFEVTKFWVKKIE